MHKAVLYCTVWVTINVIASIVSLFNFDMAHGLTNQTTLSRYISVQIRPY